jgi:TPR repeat protein
MDRPDLQSLQARADEGSVVDQFRYGVLLFNGDGIPIDKSLAAHYYKLAADQGLADAQFNYGCSLFNGD